MKSIVWDLDGTLFNTLDLHIVSIKKSGKIIINKEMSKLEILKNQRGSILLNLYSLFGEKYYNEIQKEYKSAFIELLNKKLLIDSIGIVNFLKEIDKTNEYENYIFTGRDKRTTYEILKYFNILNLFKEIICIDDCNNNKMSKFYIENFFCKLTNPVYITDDTKEVKYFRDNNIETYQVEWFNLKKRNNNDNKKLNNIDDIYEILEEEKI